MKFSIDCPLSQRSDLILWHEIRVDEVTPSSGASRRTLRFAAMRRPHSLTVCGEIQPKIGNKHAIHCMPLSFTLSVCACTMCVRCVHTICNAMAHGLQHKRHIIMHYALRSKRVNMTTFLACAAAAARTHVRMSHTLIGQHRNSQFRI